MIDPLKILSQFARCGLGALQGALAQLPKNDRAFTYDIRGLSGDQYITRTLLSRLGGRRLVVHRIHRADEDQELHNHPWRTAAFLVVTGGYAETRLVDGDPVSRILVPGDVNCLDASTYHRIEVVWPDTWTVGVLGERCQDWGFLVDGAHVHWQEFFRRKGHAVQSHSLT